MRAVLILVGSAMAVVTPLGAQVVDGLRARVTGAITADELRTHAAAIVAHPRPSGSPGENAAIDYIERTLRDAGVPVTVHTFTAYTSNPVSARVAVPALDYTAPAITMSFSASAHDLRARLVDVGTLEDLPPLEVGTGERLALPIDHHSTLPDLRGAIALVTGQPRNIPVIALEALGAVGAIFVNPEERLNELIVTSTWGTPSLRSAHRLPVIPSVQVARSAGERLRQELARGPVTVSISAEVDTGWKPLRVAVARIDPPGNDNAPYALFGGHIDAWHYGGTDEGASNAAMLSLAIAFHRERANLRRGLVVAWWPGHSNARYGGSTWFADTFFEELSDRAIAYLNIDGVGQIDARRFGANTTASLAALAQHVVMRQTGNTIRPTRPGRNSDQSFNGIGLPLLQLNHSRLAADGGYWWWHTPDDTFDKIDFDVLEQDTDLYAGAIAELLADDQLPLDLAAQVDELVDALERRQAAAGDAFDLSLPLARARALRALVERIDRLRATLAPSAGLDLDLVAALRPLHRVLYSPNDPFHPDAGDVSGPLPGLAPVTVVAETAPGTDRHGFALTTLLRERNRVVAALAEANARFEHIAARYLP